MESVNAAAEAARSAWSKEQQVWSRMAEERMSRTYDGPDAPSHAQWRETPGGQDCLEKSSQESNSTGEEASEGFAREWDEAEAHDLFWNYPYAVSPAERRIGAPDPRDGGPTQEFDLSDVVNQPSHYTYANIECIDAIREVLGESFWAYCIGNALKYIWRHQHKGGVEDLEKAQVYLDWAIESL